MTNTTDRFTFLSTYTKTRGAVVAIAVAVAVAGCGGTSSSSGSSPHSSSPSSTGGSASLTVGSVPDQTTLDAVYSNDVGTNDLIYDSLIETSPTGQLQPALALSWKANRTGTRWVFTLRKGVTFQNGAPFTAADVVWTYRKDESESSSLVGPPYITPYLVPKDVMAKGKYTVIFKLKQPTPVWPRQTTLVPILPQASYNSKTFAAKPIGTGAWEVVSYSPSSSLVLKANPHYWGGKPPYAHLTVDYITDENARLNALRSGSLQLTALSAATLPAVRGDSSVTVATPPSNVVDYLGYDGRNPALQSLTLRRAIDMAINRDALVKNLFGGAAQPAGSLLAPATFGYSPTLKPTAYDVAQAKALVKQSGYHGQTIDLDYPNGTLVPEASQLAQTIGSYLGAIGVKTSLVGEQQATFVQDWLGKKFSGLYLFSIQPSTQDASLVYDLLLNSSGTFTDPRLGALFSRQSEEGSIAARKATLIQLARYIQQHVYYSPLLIPDRIYAYDKGRVEPQLRADGYFFPQFYRNPGS